MEILGGTMTYTLDEETEKRLYEMLTDVDVSITPSLTIHDKHGNTATYSKEPHWIPCSNCARNADNGGLYPDGRTRCPIQEHYALPKDGYCHLAEPWRGEER